jgi:hypothetical protein
MDNTKASTARNIEIRCINKNYLLLQDPGQVLQSSIHYVVAILAGLKDNP